MLHQIGKNITRYNAYDTGIFLCSVAIFDALEESLCIGDTSLSAGIKVLAEKQKAKAFDIEGNFWIDIDDKVSLKRAQSLLLNRLTKPSDGPVSRYLNRPISTRISKLLLRIKITPNSISFFSFILALGGSLFFFLGGYINLVRGAILAQISSIIDGCDGEIARLEFKSTEFGKWFDAVLDRYADGFLLFGLSYYVYFNSITKENFFVIFLGFLAIMGTFLNSYTADKYDGLMKRKLKQGKPYFRIGRDIRMFIIFLGALINQPFWTLALIALLMNIENIRRVAVLYCAHSTAHQS